jgi:hypothetical protein
MSSRSRRLFTLLALTFVVGTSPVRGGNPIKVDERKVTLHP